MPQTKSTELCSSSAAVVPQSKCTVVLHKVNLPSCEVAQGSAEM